ncbi:MAG: type II toxin-antitoxin system RelE/ParE family toxin [Dongiaceae bacterium]
MAWTLRQYRSAYDDFYAACDPDLQEAIDQRLAYLLEHGNLTGAPASKPLGNGLFELRANTHRHQVRFLYFFREGKVIIVVSAFFKKTKKTPQSEIDKAMRRKRAIELGEEPTNGSDQLH